MWQVLHLESTIPAVSCPPFFSDAVGQWEGRMLGQGINAGQRALGSRVVFKGEGASNGSSDGWMGGPVVLRERWEASRVESRFDKLRKYRDTGQDALRPHVIARALPSSNNIDHLYAMHSLRCPAKHLLAS